MTRVLLLTALLAAAVACADSSGGGGEEVDVDAQRQAVTAVSFLLGDAGSNPPIGQPYDCGLSLSGATPVPGRCLWTAMAQPNSWLVTFRETWACSQFARDVQGYPACTNLTAFHEWQYEVLLETGGVQLVNETGQFPPDYAQ